MLKKSRSSLFRNLLTFAVIVVCGALLLTVLIETLFGEKQIPDIVPVVTHITAPNVVSDDDADYVLNRLTSEGARKGFTSRYAAADLHKAFAVSAEGYWGYATKHNSPELAGRTAMWWCEKSRIEQNNQASCKVVHIDDDWLPNHSEQTPYRIDINHIHRGIMPVTQELLSGEYARAQEHKALATSAGGYYGYATGHESAHRAAKAAVTYCEDAARKQGKDIRCNIQLINDQWQ